jgi:predicted nuclease with TOPRIM domain
MTKDEEIQQLKQENETLHEGLKQALMAIDFLQARVKELEQQQGLPLIW